MVCFDVTNFILRQKLMAWCGTEKSKEGHGSTAICGQCVESNRHNKSLVPIVQQHKPLKHDNDASLMTNATNLRGGAKQVSKNLNNYYTVYNIFAQELIIVSDGANDGDVKLLMPTADANCACGCGDDASGSAHTCKFCK